MARLRCTAPPTFFFPATTPTRGGPGFPDATITTTPPLRSLRPVRKARWKAERPRRDAYGRPLGGDTLPPFGATALQDRSSRARTHPGTKTVLPFASPHIGLVGTFHSGTPISENREVSEKVTAAGTLVKDESLSPAAGSQLRVVAEWPLSGHSAKTFPSTRKPIFGRFLDAEGF